MYIHNEINSSELPGLFRRGAEVAKHPAQQDMLLLSLLTASSYALPNYYMRHGNPAHKYYPNLMTLVVAPPASGKGVMNLSRRLLHTLHAEKRQEAEEDAVVAEICGREPRDLMVFLPGNSSSNAFLKLLKDNEGQGIMHETEADVLTACWKHDYGNYSAAFRQTFEHETITRSRKTKGEGYMEITEPRLSVLLSGTFNQLQPLLCSQENGLASRFMCYLVEDTVPFDESAIIKHDEEVADVANNVFNELEQEMTGLNHWLQKQKKACEFRLTPDQSSRLRDYFHDDYHFTVKMMQLPLSFDPIVKRMVVSVLRIGMILRMVRYYEEVVMPSKDEEVLPEVLECTEADFRTMTGFINAMLYHAIAVHELLPSEEQVAYSMQEDDEALSQENAALQLLKQLPETFRTKDAVEAGAGAARTTINNYLQLLSELGKIVRLKKGEFKKL